MFCKICLAKIDQCLLNVNQSLINIDCCFVKDRVRYRVKAACIIINALPYHALCVLQLSSVSMRKGCNLEGVPNKPPQLKTVRTCFQTAAFSHTD